MMMLFTPVFGMFFIAFANLETGVARYLATNSAHPDQTALSGLS